MQSKESWKQKDQVAHKGRPIRTTPDFSKEAPKTRRTWADVLETLRDHRCQPRLRCLAKLSQETEKEKCSMVQTEVK